MTIVSPKGDLKLPSIKLTDRPAEIGPVDIVLFAVKLYDAEAVDTVSRHVGREHVVGGA